MDPSASLWGTLRFRAKRVPGLSGHRRISLSMPPLCLSPGVPVPRVPPALMVLAPDSILSSGWLAPQPLSAERGHWVAQRHNGHPLWQESAVGGSAQWLNPVSPEDTSRGVLDQGHLIPFVCVCVSLTSDLQWLTALPRGGSTELSFNPHRKKRQRPKERFRMKERKKERIQPAC